MQCKMKINKYVVLRLVLSRTSVTKMLHFHFVVSTTPQSIDIKEKRKPRQAIQNLLSSSFFVLLLCININI